MKKYLKHILSACLLLITFSMFSGEITPITGILKTVTGDTVMVGDSVEISTTAAMSSADYDIRNIVSLNYDKSNNRFFSSPTNVRVKLTIKRWDAASALISPTVTENLTVTIDNRYNKKTIDKSYIKLSNGYKVTVYIDSIIVNNTPVNKLPDYVYVESEIHMNRYYEYTGSAAPALNDIIPINTDCDSANIDDELEIDWGTISGAEEYQLEWVFVNDYGVTPSTYKSTSALEADFKNNATRITTSFNYYKISVAFEHGYIAFRVRAVGRDYLNPDKYIYGNWSTGSGDVFTLSAISSSLYHNTVPHEKEKNWQYSATYAEEGKKKEVISYFDGSLHNRQSVTKVNSDNNTIVGETIYDYQGRPAVNVLPTPVVFPSCDTGSNIAPSLKYYENYNRNSVGTPYTKDNFDLDVSICTTTAEPMDTLSGSSQYYSGNNPNKLDFQAFVPDAEMYPFSQVEYTPDNTGRIRAQSGVGKPFQLGNGHETQYIYSQPNQIQLDRMFGSEAGDASHYKKNTVTDANGQVSISYLNQEGKTVATSLAGNPTLTDSTYMQALSSESGAVASLHVDAFNKDYNGNTLLNKITPLQDGIEFSTQLSVSYNSTYFFDYSLSIDTLADPCLNTDFCISCIYDLEIKVTNECGVNLTPGDSAITKKVGHLIPETNGFTMVCQSPTGTEVNDTFSVHLTPGIYTVSKVLTINKDARDYYLAQYIDSTSGANHCIRTLDSFVQEALAGIDTSACYVTCNDCVAALGTKDDFVSSGQGTELQWEILLEQCTEPCKDKTLCETGYEMMLLDVTLGGQYAKYDAVAGTSTDPTSVLNESNYLNSNFMSSGVSNWRHPKIILGGTIHEQYLDDNGVRKKVNVFSASTANGWSPEVYDTTKIYTTPVTGEKYVYPENLEHLSDFISSWEPYFARSLVMYHPEFVYYIACKDYSTKFAGDARSTDQFDSLMMASSTFDEAVTNGFINPSYMSISDPNSRLTNWASSGAHAYDPFLSNASAFNNFTGPFQTSYPTSPSYNHSTTATALYNNLVSFFTIPPSSSYTFIKTAAMFARCGNIFATGTPDTSCTNFGRDYFPNPFSDPDIEDMNDSIRNSEWTHLKHFYISEKRKKQYFRMHYLARFMDVSSNPAMPSHDILGGCNTCIGDPTFTPFLYGFYSFPGSTSDVAFDLSQPCSFMTWHLFYNKQKRFVDLANTGLSGINVPYQVYQQTGQTPMAFQLQNFLNDMAQGHYLYPSSNIGLSGISTFNLEMYKAVNGGTLPVSFINYNWVVDSTISTTLYASIVDTALSSIACQFTLDISGTPIIDFTKIKNVQSLSYTGNSGGVYYFNLGVGYVDGSGNPHDTVITGSTCIDILNYNYVPQCTPNLLAVDIQNLINLVAANGSAFSSNYNMSTNSYIAPGITPTIKNTLYPSTADMRWNFVSPNKIELYYTGASSDKLLITIISFLPGTAIPSTVAYSNIRSNYNNLFKMDAMNSSGVKIADVNAKIERIVGGDTTLISMGECGYPGNPECALTEHQVRRDLEELLNECLTDPSFTGNVNLYDYPGFTPLLRSYFPAGLDTTSSVYTYTSAYDSLIFNTSSFCTFELYHDTLQPGAQHVHFNQLVSVNHLTGIEPFDAQQNFHHFYFIGTFDTGSGLVTDTVYGQSCLPLKNCPDCEQEEEEDMMMGAPFSLQLMDSLNILSGRYYVNEKLNKYQEYKFAIDSLNSHYSWTANDSNYVHKLDYLTFAKKDYRYADKYIDFVQNFDSIIDSAQYLHIENFVTKYGNYTNCNEEYKRYNRAVDRYNERAALSGANTLTAINDSVFYVNKLCKQIKNYVSYIRLYPDGGNASPQTAEDYYNIPSVINYTDSCNVLYKRYLDVYKQFEQNTDAQNACKKADVFHPLYDFEVLEKNNLCCSNQGLALFSSYIDGLENASTNCPALLQSLDSCGNSTYQSSVNIKSCQRNYVYYIEKIKAYNTSAYAVSHADSLDLNLYPDLRSFKSAGYTDCLPSYISYLDDYINASGNSSLPLPDEINVYGDCNSFSMMAMSSPSEDSDSCAIKYTLYEDFADTWNNFVDVNSSLGYSDMGALVSYSTFRDSYCHCADKYIAELMNIVNNPGVRPTPTEVDSLLYLPFACTPPGCALTAPDTLFSFPPVPYSQNPCVAEMIAVATQNAMNEYNQYIDSVRTDFIARYNEHCLHPVENLFYDYNDKEYHFTLYYYDQAGNLVKTIPPEGYSPLAITSSSDALYLQIKQDRLNKTQTVFTSHRMGTMYEYNSLNQLIRQDMPDHDKMDICESILPNGLDADLTINGVQYVNANKGYLTGYLTRTIAGTPIKRGYVYTTNNAGLNWTRIKGVAAGDIQKVQMVSSTVGYAVANYGLVFKTLDGGYSWDAITTLYTATPQYFGMLTDLYFTSTTTGIISCIKGTGTYGGVYKTTDGGVTYTAASGFSNLDTINGLAYDGTNYFASVSNQGVGKIYISSDGLTWTQQNNFSANSLKRVQYVGAGNNVAFAVGYDGTLLKSNTANTAWTLVATNQPYNFSDIYFRNSNYGIALIDSISGMARIYKTLNGGNTWTVLSAPGKYYTSLQMYDSTKVIAAGTNGTLTKVLMSTPPMGVTAINTSAGTIVTTMNHSDAVLQSTGKLPLAAVSNNDTVYFTYDAQASVINWQKLSTGISSGGFKKILISTNNSTTPTIRGILLGNDGIVYKFYKVHNTAHIDSAITDGTYFITDITCRNTNNALDFYAFDSISKNVQYIKYHTGSFTTLAAMTSTGISTSIQSIAMDTAGARLLLVGNTGKMTFGSGISSGSTSVTWTDVSTSVIPLPLNDIASNGTNNAIAVGNDGTQWYTTNGGSNWLMSVNYTSEKLNALKIDGSSRAIIGGNNGWLWRMTSALSAYPTVISLTTGTTDNFTDVAIQTSLGLGFATTHSGKALFLSNYTTSTAGTIALANNSNGALNGVGFVPSSPYAYTVGDKARVLLFGGLNGVAINDVFTTKLRSTHFYDANNGYAVDSGYVIRRTTNGGNTWSVVLPKTNFPEINKVYSVGANKAILIGKNRYAAVINSTSAPVNATVSVSDTTLSFNDIGFAVSGSGVIVGQKQKTYSVTPSGGSYSIGDLGAPSVGTDFNFNAVHVFNNGKFIAAGTRGNIYFYTGSSFVKQNNYTGGTVVTREFNDIYFHDDRVGYVVGDSGRAYKCVLTKNIGETGSVALSTDGIVWNDLCDQQISIGHTPANIDFNAIAFATRTQGFLAGSNAVANNHQHALVLLDESMMYSTRFWYDKLGRMVISQNTKQFTPSGSPSGGVRYSYTLYDALGRIKEVGEKTENTSLKHKSIFGTDINGLFNTKAIDDTKLNDWIADGSGARKEVTRTHYDTAVVSLPMTQENLRKRVSTVTYEDVYDGVDSTYEHATHYTYDIHGNVKTLLQDNRKLYDTAVAYSSAITSQRFKRVDYDYDLISGKVNKVLYQKDSVDQFIHKYSYDADNRITKVETSSDNILWQTDAKYFYYAHGPLARVEYGNDKVQGMDYAYTLQGWIKGVNSNTLYAERDMGRDADSTLMFNPNRVFAKDGFGYTLNYYTGDYKSIDYMRWNDITQRFEASTFGSDLMASTYNLYNGNIKAMATTIIQPVVSEDNSSAFKPEPMATAYKYDQLNRLVEMKAWQNFHNEYNIWSSGSPYNEMYHNQFTYDANGSMLKALAKNMSGQVIDNQTYHHQTDANGDKMSNRTYAITDSATITSGNDLLDQIAYDNTPLTINTVNNYSYTEIGERKSNKQDSIDLVVWTVYGKIKEIYRTPGSTKKNVKFDYDASGNRVAKHVFNSDSTWVRSEYYIRDAQGNIMSTYQHNIDSTMHYAQTEKHLYGSSMLGIDTKETEMIGAVMDTTFYTHALGYKNFTGNNHLGNVLTTFTDRKIPVDLNTDNIIDEYWPDVISSSDYAPFGAYLTERTFNQGTFPNSFNGKREDKELNLQDYGMRPYNPMERELGCIPDPLYMKYPNMSPYNFVGGNPISNIDPDGRAIQPVNKDAEVLLKSTFDYFGGEKFAAALRITDRNGVIRSNLINMDAATMNIKEFKNTLKDNDIKLKGGDLEAAYNLYTTLQSGSKTELAVFSKEIPGNTREQGESGTKLVEGEGASTNENFNKFSEKFDKNNAAIDQVTGGKKYGTLEYKPQNANDPDLSNKGTLIIDATGEKPKETVKTLNEALKPNQQ